MKTSQKFRLLSLVQLPPPIHGVSIMNSEAIKVLNSLSNIEHRVIPLAFTSKLTGLGRASPKKLVRLMYYLSKLVIELTFKRPKLVYFTLSPTGNSFYRDMIFVLIIRMFRIAHIFHIHGKGIREQSSGWKAKLYSWTFQRAYVIHLGETLKYDVEKFVKSDRIYVVHNGVVDPIEKGSLKLESKFPVNGDFILGFLSNLVISKGILEFLEAAKLLDERNVDFKAKVAGGWRNDGAKEAIDSFLRTCPLSLLEKIEFLGPLYGSDKDNFFRSIDIFVFPTLCDTFPLVILEALSYGVPVVASDEGGISEIVEKVGGGKIIKKGDSFSLATEIEKYHKSSDYITSHRIKSRNAYVNYFSINQFKKSYQDVIFEIIDKVSL